MVEIIIELMRFAASQLNDLDPKLSSAILSIVVIALLLFIWRPQMPAPPGESQKTIESPHPITPDVESLRNEIARLKEIAEEQQEELKDKQIPRFSSIEHIYFNTNGITNSVFVLVVALLIFEYTTLADRAQILLGKMAITPAQKAFVGSISNTLIPSIEREVAMLLAALAVMVVLCCLIVMIGRLKTGRSIEIINRSFQLSLLVAVLAFMAIAVPLSFPGS